MLPRFVGTRRNWRTDAIPIVFAVNQDPVVLGLVASLARPGGNATGINYFTGELVAKRLELLHQLVPTAVRVGVLVNPDNAGNTQTMLRDVETAARAIGLQIQVFNASSIGEIDAAFASLARARPASGSGWRSVDLKFCPFTVLAFLSATA
jgi:putative tryptophan/tyrosine transport system substrate-binding protein